MISILQEKQTIPCLRVYILEKKPVSVGTSAPISVSWFPSKGRPSCSQVCCAANRYQPGRLWDQCLWYNTAHLSQKANLCAASNSLKENSIISSLLPILF